MMDYFWKIGVTIKMKTIDILDFIRDNPKPKEGTFRLVNVRGCNGAGKSSIPMAMFEDPDTFTLTYWNGRRDKEFATVSPKYNFIALGTYKNKTGGLDLYKTNDETKMSLELVWNLGYDILMEGVIASTLKSFYVNLFQEFSNRQDLLDREITIYSILPDFETCIDRVIQRSGNSNIKREQILVKWKTVERNHKYFQTLDFLRSIQVTNEGIALGDTLKWFFENLN